MIVDPCRTTISIVTPTLNAEQYLLECLASVRGQSFSVHEHLVIDGGSTDRTEALAQDSGALWLSRPGLNQAAAINVGLRAATGEIVAWLNADDRYAPGALATVADRFESDAELEVVVGDCEIIDGNGQIRRRERPGPYRFNRLLTKGNYLPQPAVFMRRGLFDRVGYLDESLEFGMDYDLWLRLRRARVQYVPRVLAAFRWHSGSKTAKNPRASWRELLLIVRRHGGGWTLPLLWSYYRSRVSSARHWLGFRLQAYRPGSTRS